MVEGIFVGARAPCVSLRWHPLLFPLREGEGELGC